MTDRNYIIDRIKSKQMSVEEFDFDRLTAPPLSMFLSPFDINDLRYIATSVKLSDKPKEKFKMINEVMRRRGLVKLGAGTNRIIYRHPEFNNIVFKVAYDDVGMQDNPAEFRNQFYLKPFVAKTFEISPCGTVAIQERVNPIKSREEFAYIAEDVFTLLTEFIIGKYIMVDIGSSFFMNFGVRDNGFGVVLLDYSYLYELDGNKLFCRAPDPNSPSGKCDGIIDYDDGFNFLQCTKCGVKYKGKELAKNIESKMIVVKEGCSKMRVRTIGGTGAVNTAKNNKAVEEKKVTRLTDNDVDVVATRGSIRKVPTINIKEEEPKVDEPKPVAENKEVKPAFEIGERTENKLNNKRSYVYEIEKALETIKECYEMIQFDQVKRDVADKIFNTTSDIFGHWLSLTDKSMEKVPTEYDRADVSAHYLNMFIDELEDDDLIKLINEDYFKNIINKYVDVVGSINYDNDTTKYNMHLDLVGPNADYDEDKLVVYKSIDTELDSEENTEYEADDTTEETAETEESVVEEKQDNIDNSVEYYAADIASLSSFSNGNGEVIVIDDNQGGYLRNSDGSIIVIDRIQNKDVDKVSIVSKEWLDHLTKEEPEEGIVKE